MNFSRILCTVLDMHDQNRLLMSPSLQGVVPELEDEVAQFEDSFVIALIEVVADVNSTFVGSLVGISLEEEVVKLDVRASISECYDFIFRYKEGESTSSAVHLRLSNKLTTVSGPFKIKSPRLLDFDHKNKMCTMGIDLLKF